VMDVHEFQFKKVRARLYVSCHCTSDDMPLSRVHDVSEFARDSLQARRAGVCSRVLISSEPMTDNRR